MKALYNKYVVSSCEHELNISHETRGFLEAAMNGTRKHESFYFNVFDFCGTEIMKLLIRTFRRFRTTGLYSAYLDHVVLKQKEVQKDLQRQKNITKQPIISETGNNPNSKNQESVIPQTQLTTDLAKIPRNKSLIPKFYTANKHEEILSKYTRGNM